MVMSWRVLLTGALALLSLASRAQEPRFVIRQVSVDLPYITTYLDVPEQNTLPPSITKSDISSVTIQGQNLKLDNLTVNQGVAYTLLLDVSGSMRIRGEVLNVIRRWIDQLPPEDHLDIFAFGESYREIGIPASGKTTLKSELTKLRSGEQTTNLYSALEKSIGYAGRIDNSIPQDRVIVLLTDGKDESSNGSVDESKLHAEIKKSHVPIYAIGYSRLGPNEQDIYLTKLKSFADESGGFYDCAGTLPSTLCAPNEPSQNMSLENSFANLSKRMQRITVLRMPCNECRPSDNHELQISLKNGTSARVPIALALPSVPKKLNALWLYLGGLLLFVIVVVLGWSLMRKKPTIDPMPESVQPIAAPQQESGLPAHFTVLRGPEPGRVYKLRLGAKAVIGKDSGCEVVLLGDKEISGRHCELTRNGTRIEVADLGSMNGTLLNGAQVVARQRVEDGDLIRVGRTEFRVSFGDRS